MKPIEFGDWHVDWLDHKNGWVLDEHGRYIAQIVTSDEEGRFLWTPAKRDAAANLLAAAPKLLRALKRLRSDPSAWHLADEAITEAEHGGTDVVGADS